MGVAFGDTTKKMEEDLECGNYFSDVSNDKWGEAPPKEPGTIIKFEKSGYLPDFSNFIMVPGSILVMVTPRIRTTPRDPS